MIRKIIHVDMDAFYASVEQLDNPDLRGKPVLVGGNPEGRGVVAAASYEARKFGARSAMPSIKAKRLCPQAVFLLPRFLRYKEISGLIHEIFLKYTDVVESLGLDEAWLDVTNNNIGEASATRVALRIKDEIKQKLGLNCSAGVSYNKFLAKLATEEGKPNGLHVIAPNEAQGYLLRLDVRKLPYVGKVTERKLHGLGIHKGEDLYAKSEKFLLDHFGKFGHALYWRVRGIDERPVTSSRERKSISTENTFSQDLLYGANLRDKLKKLIENLWDRTQRRSIHGRTLTLKIKFKDFQQITRSMTTVGNFAKMEDIHELFQEKLRIVCEKEFVNKPIRLLGVGLSNFIQEDNIQLDFFHLLDTN